MTHSDDIHDIPEAVSHVCDRLRSAGHRALVVGGSVRDRLMGRRPNDWDVATGARPEEVMALFERAVPTGIKYGTVTVLAGIPVEVTTFRRDGDYLDGRRPENVEYSNSIEEDLARRDFTANALAWDPEAGRLIDPFGGEADIRAGIVRAVGRAQERFREDALRMLRAARFAAELDFTVESQTLAAMSQNAGLIRKVAPERIREELNRLLVAPGVRRGLESLAATGLLSQIIPEVVGAFDICAATPPELPVRLAGLLMPVGGTAPENAANGAGQVLERLKYDRKTTRTVLTLVREGEWEAPDQKEVRRLIARVGREMVPSLAGLRQARNQVSGKPDHDVEALLLGLRDSSNQALTETELVIDGQDLLDQGIPPGPRVGRILKALLEAVLDDPALNTRDRLLELAKRIETN